MIRARAARLRRPSFVPSVHDISPDDLCRVPGLDAAISYWTCGGSSGGDWVREVQRESGGCGYYLVRGGEVLGFCLYARGGFLPRVGEFPFDRDEKTMYLACVAGDARTGKRLLLRMLREFRVRGVSRVRAVASDGGRAHHSCTGDLLRSGWQPADRALSGGRFYTLAGLELGNTVEAGDLAKSLIGHVGHVRLPQLKPAVPASLVSAGEPRAEDTALSLPVLPSR